MNDFNLPDIDEEKTILKTIRIKTSTFKRIEDLSKSTNISMNRIFNECIEYALNNLNESNIKKN